MFGLVEWLRHCLCHAEVILAPRFGGGDYVERFAQYVCALFPRLVLSAWKWLQLRILDVAKGAPDSKHERAYGELLRALRMHPRGQPPRHAAPEPAGGP